jgi:hypothetical protein
VGGANRLPHSTRQHCPHAAYHRGRTRPLQHRAFPCSRCALRIEAPPAGRLLIASSSSTRPSSAWNTMPPKPGCRAQCTLRSSRDGEGLCAANAAPPNRGYGCTKRRLRLPQSRSGRTGREAQPASRPTACNRVPLTSTRAWWAGALSLPNLQKPAPPPLAVLGGGSWALASQPAR